MRKMIWLLVALLPLTAFLSVRAPKSRLSDYGFFTGDIRLQQPAAGVIPYSLNTALFSDHAEKLRFVRMPEGQVIPYNDTATFDFPVGTALVKTFYFPIDARDLSKGRRLMETRVLLHEANGWKAYPYIWNEEQTDALLDVAAGEVIGIGHGFAQGIGIGDQRYGHGMGDAGGLLDLFDLAEHAVVRHGIVERAAGMAAKVGGGKARVFDDPPGQWLGDDGSDDPVAPCIEDGIERRPRNRVQDSQHSERLHDRHRDHGNTRGRKEPVRGGLHSDHGMVIDRDLDVEIAELAVRWRNRWVLPGRRTM